MNVFVFDIETVPDVDGGRRLFGLDGLSDKDTASAMFALRRQQSGNEFLRLHLQRVVAISAVLRTADSFKVWSLGTPESSEADLIQRFYDGLDKYTPTLVSWNGGGFDLPVLHYRALRHAVTAPRYWDMGDDDNSFRWNNYISRYHFRHTDLMDVLAMYNLRAAAPLDEIAMLLGFPGKMGMSGDKVWDAYQDNRLPEIRNYCETDVLNTYLVYLRFELMRGRLTREQHNKECQVVRDALVKSEHAHLRAFHDAWSASS